MATYEGVILTNAESLNLEQRVFSAKKITIMNENAELEQKVHVAEKINLFLLGEENEVASRKIRTLKGHMTWGDENEKPRRYPLEKTWTKKQN